MPIFHHDLAQYSEVYDRLKLGIATSSHFHKIITPQGKPSKQWREYACVLIAERILQRKIEFYNSPAMERGLIVEAEAADWYEFDQDVTVQRVGFITDDNHTIGCSPDGLVGDEGLLEIKAPLPQTQVEYWISGEINERFRPQLQGQLYISQRSWVDIVCWHDVLPKVVMRVESDEQFIKALDRELQILTCLSSASWKRSAPRVRYQSRKEDWRCRRRYEQVWRSSRDREGPNSHDFECFEMRGSARFYKNGRDLKQQSRAPEGFMDTMRKIVSNILMEMVRVRSVVAKSALPCG
jgi:hypothetical protein